MDGICYNRGEMDGRNMDKDEKRNIAAARSAKFGKKPAARLALAAAWIAAAAAAEPRFTIENGVLTGAETGGAAAVEIPKEATEIGEYAFAGCDGLKNVSIHAGVAKIGEYSFYRCKDLESFEVAPGNPSYKSAGGMLLTKDGKTLVAGAGGDTAVPEGVGGIGPAAFHGRASLRSVAIPASVTDIAAAAFYGCAGLTNATMEAGVASIGDWAFCGCTSLTRLKLPRSVRSIGEWAFFDCDAMTLATFSADAPATAGSLFWDAPDGCVACVPDSASGYGAEGGTWQGMIVEFYDLPARLDVSDGVLTRVEANGDASIVIPASVAEIGENAFAGCGTLSTITLRGDAPTVADGAFAGVSDGCVVRIGETAAGYGVEDGKWHGMRVERYPTATVSFVMNGGTPVAKPAIVECGAGAGELPEPAKDGFVFRGWFAGKNDGARILPGTAILGDTAIYAHWANGWIDESEAAKNTTGSWSEEVEYVNGRIPVEGRRLKFAASAPSSGRHVTMIAEIEFNDSEDGMNPENMPPEYAKAAVSIGENGRFQAWTAVDGERRWVELAGMNADTRRSYTVIIDLDTGCGTYAVSARESGGDGEFAALAPAGGGVLAFASGRSGCINGVAFAGNGSVASIRGLDGVDAAGGGRGVVIMVR